MSTDSSTPDKPDGATRHKSLTARTVAGLQWTSLGTALGAVMQIVYAGIIGRLLDPAAFGLLAASMLVLNFSTTFAKMGIGHALIQKKTLTSEEIRAGFTSSVGLGLLVAAVIWVLSPFLAQTVLNQPGVVPVLRATALSLVLTGAGITADSLIRRRMKFRELATRSIVSYFVGYFLVGIGMALAGAGVWSLVGAVLTQAGMKSGLAFLLNRHPVKPIFDWDVYRPLYGFGGQISFVSVLEYFGQNLDTITVSRYVSAALLGQYNRAFFLVNVPLNQLLHTLSQVLFPGFSAVQHDVTRVKRGYLAALGTSAAVFVPVCAGMAVAAPEIVLVVLGDQWDPVIGILPLFAAAGAFKVLTHFAAVVCEAQGALRTKIVLQSIVLTVLAGLMWLAVGGGLRAYAAGFLAAKAIQHLLYLGAIQRLLHVQLSEFVQLHVRAALAAGITAAVIFAGRQATIAVGAPLVLVLAVEVLLGAVTLLAMLRFGPLRPMGREFLGRLSHAVGGGSNKPLRLAQAILGGRA